MDWTSWRQMIFKLALVLILSTLIFGAIVSSFLQIVNFEDSSDGTPPSSASRPSGLPLDDQNKHLFVFMQISDIHLSVYFDAQRKPDFLTFCTKVVDVVKPGVVLATGDLADSRTRAPLGSIQHEEEWKMYAEVLRESRVTNNTNWLDIRGNHDNFNIYHWDSDGNFYRKYSHRGPQFSSHYSYRVKHESETYTFIGVDSCLVPGPKRPFNFLGLLHAEDIKRLEGLKANASRDGTNMTLWFGHYPTSSIAAPKYGLKEIINGPYFCGHFHTVGNLIPKMYAMQSNGFLEAEVADWKDSRKFRVAAIDHGLFSFVDVKLNQWPIILITNPKPSFYSMSLYEPLQRIEQSTHIRVLVFSESAVNSVQLRIDNSKWAEMEPRSGGLYVYPWVASLYATGMHSLEVKAMDGAGNEMTVNQIFSLDGSKPKFPFGARFILRLHTQTFSKALFFLSVFIAVAPLLFLRSVDFAGKGRAIRIRANSSVFYTIVTKYYLLSCVNKVMLLVIGIPLYATFGPWFVGKVIDGHWGWGFVWGMVIDGSYLPGGFTYIMGLIFIMFIHIPMTCVLAHSVHCRYNQLHAGNPKNGGLLSVYCHFRHVIFAFILSCHFLYALSFWTSYGFEAWAFGFLKTWSIVGYLIVWRITLNLTPADFTPTSRPMAMKPLSQVGRKDDPSKYPLQ